MGSEMMHDDPNAVSVAPGETESVTWWFDNADQALYVCHQRGHFDAGMVGAVDVASWLPSLPPVTGRPNHITRSV